MRNFNIQLSCFVLFALSFVSLFGQTPNKQETLFKRQALHQVPLHQRINFSEKVPDFNPLMKNTEKAHQNPLTGDEQEYKEMKARVNSAKKANQIDRPSDKSQGTQAVTPTLGTNFFANTYDGLPNDNTIAVGADDKLISATNSLLNVYDTSGTQLSTGGFGQFYSSVHNKYDPRINYDPDWDRWVFVFLNASSANDSKVIVCFSETNDPTGNWNVYALEGNADPVNFGPCWTDYPQVAIGKHELFISGNLFSNSNQYQGAYIWQIKKSEGYNGAASLTSQEWSGSGTSIFAPTPCEGASGLYGPEMYLVSTNPSPFPSTTSMWLHTISDSIGSPSLTFTSNSVPCSPGYGLSPDASQKGTSKLLDTRNNRVRTAYFENDRIHFGLNATIANRTEIYYGSVQSVTVPAFAACFGTYIYSDTLDLLFPSLIYSGETDASGQNGSMLFFNCASPNHFPGTGVVHIDPDGNFSAPLIIKEGFTYLDRSSSSPERVGDYTNIAIKFNNPGEFWGAGVVGYSSNRHGTWVSQIFGPVMTSSGTPQPAAVKDVAVYPNPAEDIVNIEFDSPQSGMYEVSLFNLQGQQLAVIARDRLSQGKARLVFMTQDLQSGIYLVKVKSESGWVHSEKLIVR